MESLQEVVIHRLDLERSHPFLQQQLAILRRGVLDQNQVQIHNMDQGLQDQTGGGVCRSLLRVLVLLHLILAHGLQTPFLCNNQDHGRR